MCRVSGVRSVQVACPGFMLEETGQAMNGYELLTKVRGQLSESVIACT